MSSGKKIFNDKNMNGFIQGKKIDFNEETIEFENENENENEKNQNITNTQNLNQNLNLNGNIQNYNKIYINNSKDNIIINNNNINKSINHNDINVINNNVDNINQKSINNNLSNAYINAQPLTMNIDVSKIKCTCSKTGCQKKYCACLSFGKFFDGCNCKNCENQPNLKINNNYEQNIGKINYQNTQQISIAKTQRVICNCTKSFCMKKYCECYKQGLICNSLCRCRECKNNNNCINDYNNLNNCINNENRNINLMNDNNNNFSLEQIEYNNNPINFQSEAFGILIKKEKLKVYERKINLNSFNSLNSMKANNNLIREAEIYTFNRFNETPKYSSRKRARSKIDISNMKTCPTSNSSHRRRKGLSNVNRNIQKKKLQLN